MANQDKSSNRRIKPRVVLNLFLWYRILGDLEDSEESLEPPEEGLARVVDLSAEGVGFVSTKVLPTGGWIFLEITSPRGNLSVVGKLRSCAKTGQQYRIGVLFKVIPPNDRSLLAAILAT